MTTQFLRHYATLRLNLLTGFVDPADEVRISEVDSDGLVFSNPTATVGEIVQTIETLAFFTDQGPGSDERARLEIMKNVCERVNAEGSRQE